MEEAESEQMLSILHQQDGEMLTSCTKLCCIVQRDHEGPVLPGAGGIGTAWRAPYAHLGSPRARPNTDLVPLPPPRFVQSSRDVTARHRTYPKSTSLSPVQNSLFPGPA